MSKINLAIKRTTIQITYVMSHPVSPLRECGIDCQPTSDSSVRRRHSGAILKGHSGAELHIYFWSTWKVYTMKYFSIAELFLIALLRNNNLSPKCIGD